MKDYHINIFWSEEDKAYVADIPDLQFCSAIGDSPEEALAELQSARSLWLQSALERGLPAPEARYRPAIYAAAGG